ncbi:hypothetical protein BDF19DRAFT_171596 [Syncephalis fuscata]|nr:hypothetical protein BDF19DRAFT_171596 [Syncephalis fuscata]
MFTISHDAPRSSLVSICSSVSPKTQCNFELEPEHSTKVSRLQRWAEHIPKLPMKIGRQLQRTKPSTPTTAIVAIKSELNIKPKISSANEDDCQHEERFALPSPQLDAFRMPAMLDAEFTRISTGKSAVSLALQRHNTQKSIRTANCQPTLSRSTSNATISCATSFPLTPASPINTATEESSAILSPTHSQCRPVIRPAQRAQTQSWYGDASVNVRSEATDSTLTQQLRRPRPQKQQQQLQDEEEKRCSLRPRLLSPTMSYS